LKLYEKGQLPESVNLKNRTRGEDYDDRLRDAISEILNGKSQNEVAKRYNIPKTTIWRIIKKVDPSYKDSGVIITPDSEIVEQLLQLSKKRSSVIIKLEYADEDGEENVEMATDADEKSPIK
jgi:predicted transcriptional regulator